MLFFPKLRFFGVPLLKNNFPFWKTWLQQRKPKFMVNLWKYIFKILETSYKQASEKKSKCYDAFCPTSCLYITDVIE